MNKIELEAWILQYIMDQNVVGVYPSPSNVGKALKQHGFNVEDLTVKVTMRKLEATGIIARAEQFYVTGTRTK